MRFMPLSFAQGPWFRSWASHRVGVASADAVARPAESVVFLAVKQENALNRSNNDPMTVLFLIVPV